MNEQMQELQRRVVEALPTRVGRMREVTGLIGLSRSTIYDRLNPKSKRYDPSFPKPLRLGESAIGWQLSEILIWIGDRQPVISNMQHKD